MEIPEIKGYTDWLKSLEVGQKVTVEMYHENETVKYDVKAITSISGGIINVKGYVPFKDGTIQGSERYFTRICPLTKDAVDAADRKMLLKELYGFDARNYSTSKLRKIYAIINGNKQLK